ncbi:hypothetical protein QEN19_002295 [Hanseniaspora menglaensis]
MSEQKSIAIDYKSTNFFKPLKLSDNITLQHRGALSPLTRIRADDKHVYNLSTDYTETEEWKKYIADSANKTGNVKRGLSVEYYHQRSQRPGTLIFTEGTFPYAQAGGWSNVPGVYNDEQSDALKKIVDAVHANGSFIFVQFWNLGRVADPEVLQKEGLKYVSSSDKYIVNGDMFETKKKALRSGNVLNSLTLDEIEQVKEDYLTAAKYSFKAGADGIELHAAGGALLNQFFDKVVNVRTDHYGNQSFESRSRLFFEVFDLLVAKFGADKVGTKFSAFSDYNDMSNYSNIEDTYAFYTYVIKKLEAKRIEGKGPVYIALQEPRLDESFASEFQFKSQKISNDFIWKIYKGVIVVQGNLLHDSQYAKKLIENNDKVIFGFGRYFISNPDLIDRLEKNLPLADYDRSTFYGGDFRGYVDYPYFKK